jgi:hypothetical protein
MLIIKLVVAVLIVVGTVIGLVRVYREIRGDSPSSPRGKGKDNGSGSNELETFIAAYRRDQAAGPTAPTLKPALTSWTARKSFLAPHTKLCYLIVKAALPDHHVFCHARLADALELHSAHPLASSRLDIVVCNKELSPIAAIDICNQDERNTPAEREKSERLQSAGIRYLRFTPGSIPKPAEVRDLIYPA